MDKSAQVGEFELMDGMKLHLVGIAGSGMSAIAQVLLGRNFSVTGSDLQINQQAEMLRAQGADVVIGHRAENIDRSDAVIISSAIPADNPEISAARTAGIPVLKRADFLRYLMENQVGIAVAGTHGKTTTTAMIAQILIESDRDPSVILGGELELLGGNGRAGSGDHFVVEADEYDYMFLGLRPEIIVITNIEHDHPDIFPTAVDYLDAFCQFAALLPQDGKLIVSGEDPGIADMLAELKLPGVELITYGIEENDAASSVMHLRASNLRPNQLGGSDFVLLVGDESVGLVRLSVPGIHNVRNALAAVGVAFELGIEFGAVCRALANFGGVGRRFQVLSDVGGVTVIDDYAHHPTEIKATLAAARERFGDRRIWAVWQPHTYSRTQLLQSQFAASFSQADRVIMLDIYGSRETDDLGLDTAGIAARLDHPSAVYIGAKEDAADYLLDRIRPGDVVLTLGAGDGNIVGQIVIEVLQRRMETFRP